MIRTLTLVAGGLLASCAGQAGSAKESGFLSDYSRLEPGGQGDPLRYYVKPELDLAKYPDVMIDPVMIRAASEDALKSVPLNELEHLVELFYQAVREQIGGARKIVTEPAPGTMRLRLAITEIIGSNVGNDVVSTIHPVGLLTNVGTRMATGTRAFAGRVSIEGELTDASNGTVLVQFVDRRQDGDRFQTGEWRQVEDALKFWAAAMRRKLDELSR